VDGNGGIPEIRVSIDEKPVSRCAYEPLIPLASKCRVSIDEKPVSRCASRATKSLTNKQL